MEIPLWQSPTHFIYRAGGTRRGVQARFRCGTWTGPRAQAGSCCRRLSASTLHPSRRPTRTLTYEYACYSWPESSSRQVFHPGGHGRGKIHPPQTSDGLCPRDSRLGSRITSHPVPVRKGWGIDLRWSSSPQGRPSDASIQRTAKPASDDVISVGWRLLPRT